MGMGGAAPGLLLGLAIAAITETVSSSSAAGMIGKPPEISHR